MQALVGQLMEVNPLGPIAVWSYLDVLHRDDDFAAEFFHPLFDALKVIIAQCVPQHLQFFFEALQPHLGDPAVHFYDG